MDKYNEALSIINEQFGNGKDNIIALATIDLESGTPRPVVRDVDAFYEEGVFYIITYALTRKVKQLEANPQVGVSVNFGDFNGMGIAKNHGWVMKPENSEVRAKMHNIFKEWYEVANNESDENFVIVSITLKEARLRLDHGAVLYILDMEQGVALN